MTVTIPPPPPRASQSAQVQFQGESVPPVNESSPVADEPRQSDPDSVSGTAALVQVAGLAVQLADQTGDPRLKRIADLALKEVTGSGVVRDLVKIIANPKPDANHDVLHQRDVDRERRQAEFQQAMANSQMQRNQTRNLTTKVAEMLLRELESKLTPPDNKHSPAQPANDPS